MWKKKEKVKALGLISSIEDWESFKISSLASWIASLSNSISHRSYW